MIEEDGIDSIDNDINNYGNYDSSTISINVVKAYKDNKEIIYNIIKYSGIWKDLTTYDWEDLTIEDLSFIRRNDFLVRKFKKCFPLIDAVCTVALLKIFLKNSYFLSEVLNSFHMINNTLQHIKYFEHLLSFNEYNQRQYNDDYIEQYFNRFQNKRFIYLINEYKTKKLNRDLVHIETQQLFYKDFQEKRRSLIIDDQGFFNYICALCVYKSHSEIDEYCPYSHNEMEILYHPLVLKTKFCRNSGNCDETYCSFSHDEKEDFRLIYQKGNILIKSITKYCLNYEIFCSKNQEIKYPGITNSINFLPGEFHPDTYKTLACPLGTSCKLDDKLCLNYHNDKQRRRDYRKFKYSHKPCPYVHKDNKFTDLRNCKDGDSCGFSHSIYEHLYCKENFRKKECENERKGRVCDYLLICPFKHLTDHINFDHNICYSESSYNYYAASIKNKIDLQLKKIQKLQNVLDYQKCMICYKNFDSVYVKLTCGHLICSDCELLAKNKMVCNFCNNEISSFKKISLK